MELGYMPKIHLVTIRADSLLIACDPGPCGGCNTMRSFFVCREGKSQCVDCDKQEQDRLAVEGRRAGAQTKAEGAGL